MEKGTSGGQVTAGSTANLRTSNLRRSKAMSDDEEEGKIEGKLGLEEIKVGLSGGDPRGLQLLREMMAHPEYGIFLTDEDDAVAIEGNLWCVCMRAWKQMLM